MVRSDKNTSFLHNREKAPSLRPWVGQFSQRKKGLTEWVKGLEDLAQKESLRLSHPSCFFFLTSHDYQHKKVLILHPLRVPLGNIHNALVSHLDVLPCLSFPSGFYHHQPEGFPITRTECFPVAINRFSWLEEGIKPWRRVWLSHCLLFTDCFWFVCFLGKGRLESEDRGLDEESRGRQGSSRD